MTRETASVSSGPSQGFITSIRLLTSAPTPQTSWLLRLDPAVRPDSCRRCGTTRPDR
ncbi:hypothetical protein ACFFX0_28890 [Citricoccus parietis]